MFGYSATVPRPTLLHPLHCAVTPTLGGVAGYGTSLDQDTARIRAICEGLERYCAVMYPTDGLIYASARQLGATALEISSLPRCSEPERAAALPQWRLRQTDADRDEYWVRGYSLTGQCPTWLPLSVVYLGLPFPISEHLAFPMSTGFAAGTDYEGAVLAGLLEVIERDSLALWWLHQLPFPRLASDSFGATGIDELVARAEYSGTSVHLFDLTTDIGVPVVGVIEISRTRAPHVLTMAASRLDPAAAALRVVEEAGSLRIALGGSRRQIARDAFLSGDPREPEDFGLLYSGFESIDRFAFATAAPSRSAPLAEDRKPPTLRALVRRLSALNIDVFAVDVTLPEVRDLGIVVVKVVVPALMPLTFSHNIRYLGHPRLYAAPRCMGYGDRTEGDITDDPIPFA